MYLLLKKDWVLVDDLCAHFQIDERILRADGKRRPLCRHFAISSSTRGLKHITNATTAERVRYKNSRRKTMVAAIRATREYNEALRISLTGKFPHQLERFSGQLTLFPLS
jgi:hypothetical protein